VFDQIEAAVQRVYHCRCGNVVFFLNSSCLNCGAKLGYEPRLGQIFPLEPGVQAETWQLTANPGKVYQRCGNLLTAASCNWLVKVNREEYAPPKTLCLSCRLNHVIPDLSFPENAVLWGRIEVAKRRALSSLVVLGLPMASRLEDPRRGLAFDFLRSPAGGLPVLTRHDNGTITLNIEEADDARREQTRVAMREPYRTLVGHFRHEAGHYYWYRLISGSSWLELFRSVFGDERTEYMGALESHYAEGPRRDWRDHYVTAYASIHPWEDWAETWAHYLHMLDTLGTALSFGLRPDGVAIPFEAFRPDVLSQIEPGLIEQGLINQDQADDPTRFLSLLNGWLKLTSALNELSRGMGQPDFYPFVLPRPAVCKLYFVHTLIRAVSAGQSTSSLLAQGGHRI
jgi:hypothetical protein